jgi:hypothetical protein
MLEVKTEEQRETILGILEKDNQTTYHTFEDGNVENIMIDGNISFDAMAKIVDYLRLKIKQGSWYKCVKDVMDNKCEVRLFTKDEYYLCPKDGMLVTDNNKTMQWQEWHHPENCFVEVKNK